MRIFWRWRKPGFRDARSSRWPWGKHYPRWYLPVVFGTPDESTIHINDEVGEGYTYRIRVIPPSS